MRRRGVVLATTVAVILILDQVTKTLVRGRLPLGQPIPVLDGLVYLTHARNTGAAFSILQGKPWVFASIAIVAVIAALVWFFTYRPRKPLVVFGLAILLGGTLGNLADRIRFGYVTDFVDVRIWPVFNVADSAIVVGAALLALATILERPENECEDYADESCEAQGAAPPEKGR